MAVANSDYVPDPFPGISAGAPNLAPGSQGDRTAPPDADEPAGLSGLPGTGTILPASLHGGAPGQSTSTMQPGQNDASVIAPGPASGYTSTGAGGGHTDAWARRDYQQEPGG